MKLIPNWLRALFVSPPPQSAEPKFILPETLGKYRTILAELNAKAEAFRAGCEKKAQELEHEAAALIEEANAELQRSNDTRVALAEMVRRGTEDRVSRANKLTEEAGKLKHAARVAEDCYAIPPEHWFRWNNGGFEKRPEILAKKLAERWEQEQIAQRGVLVYSKTYPASDKKTETCFRRPCCWDRKTRKVVYFQGTFYLWQLCSRAKVTAPEWDGVELEGMSNFIFSPTGEYEPAETDFFHSCTTQMNNDELRAIDEFEKQKK